MIPGKFHVKEDNENKHCSFYFTFQKNKKKKRLTSLRLYNTLNIVDKDLKEG